MSTPCLVAGACRNSPDIVGYALAKCALCRLSPDNEARDMAHYWSPTKFAKEHGNAKHPDLESEKRYAKVIKRGKKLLAKKKRDITRRKVSRLASQAEKTTEKQIIHATKNSGRSNKDGDHVLYNSITLDTKLQTTRSNPVIFIEELEKVRADAIRAGKVAGGLVIRNKSGIGCVVFKEGDIEWIFKGDK